MIELKKYINSKKIPEYENPEKIVNVVEKIFNFNNQQKGKGRSRMLTFRPSDLAHVAKVFDRKVSNHKVSNHSNLKILSPNQMLQRLSIVFAQVKAGNTSENLLNEIRQII